MVARPESPPVTGVGGGPAEFRRAVASMGAAKLRQELFCEEMPAPQRIAPWSAALTADLTVNDVEMATGRIILLHDPQGNEAWDGTFRCVAYVRAELDEEMAGDPCLAEVGWSWLAEALELQEAAHHAASGTVTSVTTECFGTMTGEPSTIQLEIRASWTPDVDDAGELDMAPHVEAWGEVMCTAVGLLPLPEGVTAIPSRRGQRGT